MGKRAREVDRIAAQQLACEILDGDRELMGRIARAARAPVHAASGPAFDEIARLLLRGDDPLENIGLIVDAVERELRPRGPTFDPSMLESHGGVAHPMDLLTSAFYDAPAVWGAGRAKRARLPKPRLVDHGQNHRDHGHRQAEKRAIALTFGQLGFCGLDWRAPAANDDDFDGGDFDGEGVTA